MLAKIKNKMKTSTVDVLKPGLPQTPFCGPHAARVCMIFAARELLRNELAEKFFARNQPIFSYSVWSSSKILAKRHQNTVTTFWGALVKYLANFIKSHLEVVFTAARFSKSQVTAARSSKSRAPCPKAKYAEIKYE